MSTRLVITGVAGFIGRHVAAEAVKKGYRVLGIDRRDISIDGVECRLADIREGPRVATLVRGSDAVIHLAGVTSNVEFVRTPTESYDINVNGFMSVVDAAARAGCERFVYASSSAVYVDEYGEDSVLDPLRQGSHYAKSKMINEMMAASYEEACGIRTTGLRYFNVYGHGENLKGDYASIVSLFLQASVKGEPLVVYGDGKQARDLIHVNDVAKVTLTALEKGTAPLYNVGTGVATPYNSIAQWIGGDVRYVPNPLASYQHYTRASTVKLREMVGGWEFMTLREGVAELLDTARSVSARDGVRAGARRDDRGKGAW